MTKVRIVGGGVMGVLAAFEAHRLGCRDIEIHEREELLGGADLPDCPLGLELREEPVDFGPRGGPLRSLLEWRGLAFDAPEAPKSEASPFGAAKAPAGGALADWIRAHPPQIAEALGRYCQWRLNAWLDEIDDSAVEPLGLGLIDPIAPPAPRDGLGPLFGVCDYSLRELGVTISTQDLVTPWRALAGRGADEVVVWAADPTPLFKACDLETPKAVHVAAPIYFFRAEGAAPCALRDFTGAGAVAALRLYESRRQMVAAAECVREASDAEVRRDVARLAHAGGLEGLVLHEQHGVSLRPRRGYRSVEQAHQIRRLRATLAADHGDALITATWEPFSAVDRFAALRTALSKALAGRSAAVAAA